MPAGGEDREILPLPQDVQPGQEDQSGVRGHWEAQVRISVEPVDGVLTMQVYPRCPMFHSGENAHAWLARCSTYVYVFSLAGACHGPGLIWSQSGARTDERLWGKRGL